jgi:hypothetical protein
MEKIIKRIIFFVLIPIILSAPGRTTQNYKNISFKISGSLSTLGLIDVNTYLLDSVVYYDTLFQPFAITRTDEMKTFQNSQELNIEFSVRLSRYFGVGLGIGYNFKTLPSKLVWENLEYGSFSLAAKPKINYIPVALNGYFFLPISSGIKAYIKGGAGVYLFQSELEFDEESLIEGEEFNSHNLYKVNGNGLGLNGGLGLEIDLSSSMALFIEGTGHYIDFSAQDGSLNKSGSWGIRYGSGEVWFYEYYDENISQHISGITYGDKPEREDLRNLHRFKIDLSGLSIRIGFRFSIGSWE